jgi:hypothetical protein
VALTVFILLRERPTRAARSRMPAQRAISKMRCWVRIPNPGIRVSEICQELQRKLDIPGGRAAISTVVPPTLALCVP